MTFCVFLIVSVVSFAPKAIININLNAVTGARSRMIHRITMETQNPEVLATLAFQCQMCMQRAKDLMNLVLNM